MDDIGKALIMGAQVLMFAFAATIAIYLYSTITNRVDGVMLANNYSNRGDAIVADQNTATARTATKAEVIMAILDLKNKYEKTGDSSYSVEVNGRTYKYIPTTDSINISDAGNVSFGSNGLRMALNGLNDSYDFSYDNTGKTLIYN